MKLGTIESGCQTWIDAIAGTMIVSSATCLDKVHYSSKHMALLLESAIAKRAAIVGSISGDD